MKINEVTTVITEKPKDKSKVPNRLAALDKDGDKVLWKDVIKDPSKAHAEIDVDGIDYKIYIDDKDNNMYVFDASRGSFVKADQNFVRRAMGKNLSSRLSVQRDPKFTDIVRSYLDKDDLRQPGAGQATKSSNVGGVIGSRIGGHIDNLIKRVRGKKAAQNNWTKVYGVEPPKPNDTIVWLTADGNKATGKVISELGSDMDGDGVPELSIKMAQGTVAIKSTAVISINGIPLRKSGGNKPSRTNPTSNDPGDTGLRNPNTGDPAAI